MARTSSSIRPSLPLIPAQLQMPNAIVTFALPERLVQLSEAASIVPTRLICGNHWSYDQSTMHQVSHSNSCLHASLQDICRWRIVQCFMHLHKYCPITSSDNCADVALEVAAALKSRYYQELLVLRTVACTVPPLMLTQRYEFEMTASRMLQL